MNIELKHLERFGDYVVPFDMHDGPPRGFVFDGDSCVIDVDLHTAARHDWDYLTGAGYWKSNWRYFVGFCKDLRPLWGLVRFTGLTAGGWVAYWKHRREQRRFGLAIRIAERMVPESTKEGVWVWPVETWLLKDLKRR